MNAITVNLPNDLIEKVRSIAAARNIDIDTLISQVMAEAVRQNEAYYRFQDMAERGRGREEEALALLRR
jgi:predicted transcriptional regulator